MARHEDQAQDIVLHLVNLCGEIAMVELLQELQLATDQLLLALQRDTAAQRVDAPTPGSGHQPRRRVIRDARPRPLLQGGDQRVLGQILGNRYIAHDTSQPGDQPG